MDRVLPRASAASQGVDVAGVDALLDREAAQRLELHSLMVVRHGYVVAEGWWAPFTPDRPHLLYSLTKSFTSMAVGLAVESGRLRLTDRVVDVLPDHVPEPVPAGAAALTVHHLLSMTTGHHSDTLEPAWALEPDDLVRGFLRRTPDGPAGTRHAYDNAVGYVLTRMVERTTGRGVPDLLRERLFGPMGVAAEWERLRGGATFGFHGLYLTTEAVAAFGELLLRGGRWHGRQLVPAEWVALATRRHVDTHRFADESREPDWLQGYGYHFWRSRHGYRGDGAMGQFCLVVPDSELVVAITASTTRPQAVLDAVWDCLLPALDQPAAAPPHAERELADRLRRLTFPLVDGEERAGHRLPPTAVDAGPGVLPAGSTIAVEPGRDGAVLRIRAAPAGRDPAVAFDVPVGYREWRESAPLGRPVVAAGAWQGEAYVAELFVVTSPSRVRVTVGPAGARTAWNQVPLVGPPLLPQLRAPLVTRPDRSGVPDLPASRRG